MKVSGHKTFDAFQKIIKLDELFAFHSLKKLTMFAEVLESNQKKSAVKKLTLKE
jgi:hypothetical protein